MTFKKKIPLAGADVLMLAFDRIHRRAAGRGNVCALAIHYRDLTSAHSSAELVAAQPAYRYLNSLRLRSGPLRYSWKPVGDASARSALEEVALLKAEDLPIYVESLDCQPRRDPAFRALLLRLPGHSAALLFVWHHALIDARGAEHLIGGLLRVDELDPELLMPRIKRNRSWSDIRKMKQQIFRSAAFPISTLTDCRLNDLSRFRYRRIRFTADETARVDDQCRELGAEVFKSSIYLGAAARGVLAVLHHRGRAAHPLHLIVPHNLRRGKKSGLLSNQVSFLFYRIASGRMQTLRESIGYLIDQSSGLIAANLHHACEALLDVVGRSPVRIVERMVSRPSRGDLATFYFSDTGELALGRPDSPEMQSIADAVHYPPHFAPPGLTAVFSRFAGQLTVMLIAAEETLSDEELALLESHLRTELTGVEQAREQASTN